MLAQPLPAHVRQAGEDIAADLFNASIVKATGNLGGATAQPATDPRNQDIVDAYLAESLTSVEAIFIAMSRASATP